MRYFDKAFFKFLFVFLLLILISLGLISYAKRAYAALININTATLVELDTLPGVGPATAQSIIDNRPYTTVEEISRADGIGEPGSSSYNNIIGLITVGVSPTPSPEATSTVATHGSQSSSAPTYAEISSSPISLKLKISKDRVGSMGSPMLFKAEVSINNAQDGDFRWNFGDGSVGYGRELSHIYEYPGEYVAVLTFGSVNGESARVNVKITERELIVTVANPDRIEIKNNSEYEANLFGQAMVVGDGSFIFPQDTILKPGAVVSFSSKVTKLTPSTPAVVNIFSLGTEQLQFDQRIEREKQRIISQTEEQLKNLELALAKAASARVAVTPQVTTKQNPETEPLLEDPVTQTASVAKAGWFEKFKRFLLGAR